MLGLKVLVPTLLLVPALLAQEIPAGTVMPVMLQSTLNAKKARIGQTIQARVMQEVPLSAETRIRAGTKLVGHIVEVTRPGTNSGSRIVLAFDRLMVHGTSVPVTTSLRSLASMMEVFDAQLPTTAIDDRGTSQSDWVTTQIGGDIVYRGAGIVMSRGEVVGKSTDSGEVTAKLIASRAGGCRGTMDEKEPDQALWLFSPSACGAGARYGWPKNILHWKGIQESILDLCATVPIHFVIADGIVAMEGNGPLNGSPRPMGNIVLADKVRRIVAAIAAKSVFE